MFKPLFKLTCTRLYELYPTHLCSWVCKCNLLLI
uniref:Uncharacterized protein n=1 Tax=Anguilla anguilla TaxID=7936 RepID=A0A0E9W296_ANGAN